ncbi:uncharacterized protein KQ657_002363 [Scheffersomyces spartinae]|uniref:SUI1 domain-containing protein n=1 Tax=Scheffersomyces spartinae TaxID=45513 RepID=A0A9P8AKJ6_9ASCO|nr:uncharacterized protein KQ657_002363 [Scheffersomyces spartinae]KAG7195976.1 hypothetical protein KQ657_002363 [Scheffersomyces spartinae]
MFTKKLQFKLASNIKTSERRAVLAEVIEYYNLKNVAKEYELLLLPKTIKAGGFSTVHHSQTIKGTIFSDDSNVPVWFDIAGNQLLPTVFTCWKCPGLLPQVVTHQYVIERLTQGANLMMRGISGPYDPRCKPDTIVGVVDYLRPNVILAVGVCLVLLPEDREKNEGVVVRILHTVNDLLYQLNDNEGVVIPKEIELVVEQTKEEVEPVEEVENVETGEQEAEDNNCDDDRTDDLSRLGETVDTLSLEDVDNFFTRGLLQSIKLDSIETPISSSTLMSNHILKHVPPPQEEINMKKTSWKKTAKYLKAMEKLGYITLKGKGDDLTVVKVISTSEPVIQNFVPTKIKHPTVAAAATAASTAGNNSLQVIKLYRGKSNSLLLFPEIKDPAGYYDAKELRQCLEQYIRVHQLADPKNKKQVLLNDDLKKLCKSATQESKLTRDKLTEALLKSLVHYHQIVSRDDDDNGDSRSSPIVSGEPPKVQVITETRIGRKVVTRLYNFEPFRVHASRFADELKVKCSGSATIGTNAMNKTEIMVQGPHGKLVVDLLKEKGVPVSHIEFEDKSKKKRKK